MPAPVPKGGAPSVASSKGSRGSRRGWTGARATDSLPVITIYHISTGEKLGTLKLDTKEGNINVQCCRCERRINKRCTGRTMAGDKYNCQGRPIGAHIAWLHQECKPAKPGELADSHLHFLKWHADILAYEDRKVFRKYAKDIVETKAQTGWEVLKQMLDDAERKHYPRYESGDEPPQIPPRGYGG